jgi:hypothetical protein
MVLTNEAGSSSAIDSSTESFLAGSNYEDFYGNTYTVSNSGEKEGSIWSITGTNGTSFNAQWQTGPAGTNTIVGESSCISDYPYGYLPGRSYGATGENDFSGWREGGFLAVIQAEDTIYLSEINCNGFTDDQFLITKGGTGGTGNSGKGSFSTDYYYVNKFNGEAIIRINRTDGGDGMVSAMYSTSDGSAVAYTDYIPVSGGMLAWAAGETNSNFITIDIPETARSGKTFSLHLTNPVGWELGSQKDVTVEIFEDIGDVLDGPCTDTDTDGVCDADDNCPLICNSDQLDADGDGDGDVCDASPGCGGISCGVPQPVCEESCGSGGCGG